MPINVLVTMVSPTPEIEALFTQFTPRVNFHFLEKGERVEDSLDDVEVLYGTLKQDDFHKAKKLRWLQTNSTGVEHILYPEFQQSDIILTNIGRAVTSIVADHALALFLALARNLHHQRDMMHQHMWQAFSGRDVGNMVLGILGLGNIGLAIAQRAKAMVREIHALDIRNLSQNDIITRAYNPDQLEDFLHACDAVICSLPLTPQTSNLFSDREFQCMKSDSYLINICRGEVVNETALLRALRAKEIAGAAIDVLAQEPLPPDNPLWDEPNLLITPHSAGYCENLSWRKMKHFAENLKHYIESGTIPESIDKARGW
jgi:phosphoglycerate dehydrogenase-like enzyme